MILQQITLERLQNPINEETKYRPYSKLLEFFNQLSCKDQYCQGFPSRWAEYTTAEEIAAMNTNPNKTSNGLGAGKK